jgi:hypothetical protein
MTRARKPMLSQYVVAVMSAMTMGAPVASAV